MRLLALFIVLLLGAGTRPAFADSLPDQFEAANRLYEQGKFAAAMAGYEGILGSNQVAAVYFNLGNASYKAGFSGRAMAAYRKAEQLAPRDPDLRANIGFVRAQVQGLNSDRNALETWIRKLTLNEWTAVATIPCWIWLFLLASAQFKPAWRQPLRGWIAGFGAISAVSLTLLVAAWKVHATESAVVIVREAVVRNGPLDDSPAAFNVHDGAELRLLDRKNDWAQVRVANRTGWIRIDQLAIISPLGSGTRSPDSSRG